MPPFGNGPWRGLFLELRLGVVLESARWHGTK